MVSGMAKRKVTYSLNATTVALAEQAASRAGLSTSAWLDRVARREAVRTGIGPARRLLADAGPADARLADALLTEARLDETERAAAEHERRATR